MYKNTYIAYKNMIEVKITTEFIKLDSFLKFCGAVSLGSDAKMYIFNEQVFVNGEVCLQRGRKLYQGDTVKLEGSTYKVI